MNQRATIRTPDGGLLRYSAAIRAALAAGGDDVLAAVIGALGPRNLTDTRQEH